jgi:hypothetical protein
MAKNFISEDINDRVFDSAQLCLSPTLNLYFSDIIRELGTSFRVDKANVDFEARIEIIYCLDEIETASIPTRQVS